MQNNIYIFFYFKRSHSACCDALFNSASQNGCSTSSPINHFHPVPILRMRGALVSLPTYGSIAWCWSTTTIFFLILISQAHKSENATLLPKSQYTSIYLLWLYTPSSCLLWLCKYEILDKWFVFEFGHILSFTCIFWMRFESSGKKLIVLGSIL
jgi:hypothetical protein